MGKTHPRPTGELQGENVGGLPDRGTSTGFNGDTYGADVSQSALNRMRGISGDTKSHAPDARPGSHNHGKGGCC